MAQNPRRLDPIRGREWKRLQFRDPRTDLLALSDLQRELTRTGTPPRLDDLRQHGLKQYLEARQAAIFAYLASEALVKTDIEYAMKEGEDYDCVLRWKTGNRFSYMMVQLKELVPSRLNSKTSLNEELLKLTKYSGRPETVIAIHINRSELIDPRLITLPKIAAGEIWLFGAASIDQASWYLYGDLLNSPSWFTASWPE